MTFTPDAAPTTAIRIPWTAGSTEYRTGNVPGNAAEAIAKSMERAQIVVTTQITTFSPWSIHRPANRKPTITPSSSPNRNPMAEATS